jgi:hypothetical protein
MKVVTKNNVQSDREKQKKKDESEYRIVRQAYIEKLKSNSKFQKFIVKDLLQKALDDLNDLSKIPTANFTDKQELGELVFASQIARTKLKSIISELLD